MQKVFKIGDEVRRSGESDPAWELFCAKHKKEEGIYTVTGVSSNFRWISVDHFSIPVGFYLDPFPFSDGSFELVEKDEILPPVKDHALYLEPEVSLGQPLGSRQTLEIHIEEKSVEIAIGDYDGYSSQTFTLEPNDALDLANDLIRMALNVKRQTEKE